MTTNSINNSSSGLTVSNVNITGSTISTVSTNSSLTLSPNGSGTILAPSISFDSGTNKLSSYVESGTFTPAVEFGGSSTGITYDFQIGNYSRIGQTCNVSLEVSLTSKGTATGDATIVNLPFIIKSGTFVNFAWYADFLVYGTNIPSFVGTSSVIGMLQCVSSLYRIQMTDTNFLNNTKIQLTGTYIID